jgi:hypothetical protein
MDNQISCADDPVAPVGSDTGIEIAIESRRVQPQGEVIEPVRGVVDVGQEGLHRSCTGEGRRVVTLRKIRRVERHDVRAEWRAAAGNDRHSRRIEGIRYVVLMQVVGFDRNVPVLVELVIVGAAEPLQVVVTPLAAP